jgi:hypothetical protein
LSTGGFVVVWDRAVWPAGLADIHVQIFDASGAKVGDDFIVTPGRPGQFSSLDVAGLPGGGFVVTWADDSHDEIDQDYTSIRARVYDGTGHPIGADIEVNTATAGYQMQPVAAALSGGDVAIVWATSSRHPRPPSRCSSSKRRGRCPGRTGEICSRARPITTSCSASGATTS